MPDLLQNNRRPPVVETVLGVQFDPLPNFSNAHLGIFWQRLGPDWSNVLDAPRLEQQFEQFGTERRKSPGQIRLWVSREVMSRLQIRNKDNDRMIQVQNGRFHYNWLGHEGGEYPTYERIRPEFDRTFSLFCEFLSDVSLGECRPNQWEITYVNHIPRGTIWQAKDSWREIFPACIPPEHLECGELESLANHWHYEIANSIGRLHVQLSHGEKEPGQELLKLELTARGPADQERQWTHGLDVGHEAIIDGFNKLTSEAARRYWGIL